MDHFVHQFSLGDVSVFSHYSPDGALTMLGMEPIKSFHISSDLWFILRSIIFDALCFFFNSCLGFQFFADLQTQLNAAVREEGAGLVTACPIFPDSDEGRRD